MLFRSMHKCILVCVLWITLQTATVAGTEPQNVALNKSTSSSSQFSHVTGSERAVDGLMATIFRSAESTNQWWKVDLGEDYFIRRIRIYQLAIRQQEVRMLLSAKDTPTDPTINDIQQWTAVTTTTTQQYNSELYNYIEYGSVKEYHLIPLARYIAVYSIQVIGIYIGEVQVNAYRSKDFLPAHVNVSKETSRCHTLRWSPPNNDRDMRVTYEVQRDSDVWTDVGETLSTELCSERENSLFSVRVRRAAVSAAAESAPAVSAAAVSAAAKSMPTVSVTAAAVGGPTTAPCTAPSEPRNLSPGTPTTVTNDGRDRWKYTVTWNVPTDTGCNSISHYQVRYPLSTSTWTNVSETSVELYADGDARIQFAVRAMNDGDFISAESAVRFDTDELRPQTTPKDVTLEKASTAGCGNRLKLVWSVPNYPNGDITEYQCKCTDDTEWNTVGADVYEVYLCNPPSVYSGIQCSVRAVNDAGNSNIANSNVVSVDCSKPSTPESITLDIPTVVTESERKRLKYVVTWQEPSDINCDSIATYKTRYPNSTSNVVSTTERSRVVYADGKVDISFYVSAVNNDNRESAAASTDITSAGLRPQIAPTSVTISVDSSTCVTIMWEPPLWPNGLITGYQYKPDTNSATAWVSIADVRNKQICGYSPNEDVQCLIRAVNSYGYSDVATTREVTTHCDAPSKPQSVTFGQHTIVNRNGRDRLKYTVTWQKPATINCTSITTYKTKYPNSNSNAQSTTERSRIVYADGSGTVRFYVSAVNNANKESSAASATKNTPIIRPQLYPRSIDITVDNSSCVTLKWQPPQWTNGQITAYQYKCNEEISWTEITNSADATQTQLCHFSPNQQVQCDLRARNSAGVSDSTTSSKVTTDCAAPTQPRSVTFSSPTVKTNETRKRLKYTVTWQEPSDINCDSITTYKTRYPSSTSTVVSTTERSRVVYADGKVGISFHVSAVNNDNKESAAASADITSAGLRPQKAPTSVTISADNSTCVTIRWEPPLWTNGLITGYQYKRDDNSGTEWIDIGDVRNKQICGYSPYELVQCMIRARNANGSSNAATTSSIRTDCAASTQPLSITFSEPTVESNSGRDRLRYTVIWQAPSTINCASITTYKTRYPNSNSNAQSTTQRSRVVYADGKVDISFYVSAVNNDNKESATASAAITSAGLRPQKTPTSVTISVDSSTCVTISWEPPLWSNGLITGYQYRRDTNSGTGWVDISDVRNKQICGYLPYELVQCMIRARNADGDSNTATTSSIRTNCTAPVLPSNLSQYVTEGLYKPAGSEFHRRKIKLNVPEQDITINCGQLNKRHYQIDGTAYYTSNNQYIVDLDAITNYSIIYRVLNSKPVATLSTVYVTTGELEPGPVLVTTEPYNLSCISLTWTIPGQPNGVITHYQYKCSHTEDIDTAIYTNYTGKREVIYCGYQPADVVTCMVKASTAIGSGPSASGHSTVECGAPGQAVFSFEETVYSINEQDRERINITVSWEAVTASCRYISHYNFSFHYNDELIAENMTSADTREFYVRDLYPYTNYTVIVTSTNDEGFNTTTEYILLTQQTQPFDEPSMELGFSTECVNIRMASPKTPNGVITNYKYMCYYSTKGSGAEYRVNASDIKLGDYPSICGFLPASEVECIVSAVNIAGESPPVTGSGYTELSLANATITRSEDVVTHKSANGFAHMPILLKPIKLVNVDSTDSYYRLIVNNPVGLGQARNKRSYMFENEACDSNRLYNYTAALAQELTCYITAEINGSLVTDEGFTVNIGDGTIENQYFNAPLEPSTNYSLVIGLVVYKRVGQSLTHYLKPMQFVSQPPVQPVTISPPDIAMPIGVGVAAVVVVAAGVAGLLIFRWRRLNNKTPESGDQHSLQEFLQGNDKPEVPEKPQHLRTSHSPYVNHQPSDDGAPDGPIPLRRLADYITDRDVIDKQYKDVLQAMPKPTMNVAQLPDNRGKCKYIGLYPEDKHRVVLERGGSPGTDFINASYLDGYEEDNAFIAAQGPLAATIDDFWLMIFQQRPKAIVMVTNVVEMGKHKCEQYWPDEIGGTMVFGELKVTLTTCDTWADYVIRSLTVAKGELIFKVKQFHFTSWPDHGVPAEMSPYVTFFRKVKEVTVHLTGTMLVHCSAGVGRTGTFIACHNLLKEAKKTDALDVVGCVRSMRLRRPCMVQVKEQYYFLHCVIDEILKTELYTCAPLGVEGKINYFYQENGGVNDYISMEYRRIELRLSLLPTDYVKGMYADNRAKNRSQKILPDGKHSVAIDGGKYINAVLTDEYRIPRHMIATQLPLSNTIEDFWRMIEEQEVKVVVQLESQDCEFYPANDGDMLESGGYKITRMSAEENEQMSVISLAVKSANQVSTVSVLKANWWNRCGDDNELPNHISFLYYLGALERHQRQSGDQKICVTDKLGSMRCGLFMAAYNSVAKLKTEQEVDLYNTVLMVRSRRRQFVSTIEEYAYLYDLLKHFTDSFSDYANFK